ncbi:MAG: hypothetical protein K8S54_11290 [Spirochaetia bacterium]|nr:hypothetical protein [Spirochaetia bacterium]
MFIRNRPEHISIIRVIAFVFTFNLSGTLVADTVIFRSGTEVTGVRTEIQGDQLTITDSIGRQQKHSMRDVKSIRPGPIAPPPGNTRLEIPPAEVQTKSPWLDHPVSLAVQGLIPGWSGLYRSNHFAGGTLMSGLELYALARLVPWIGRPVPALAKNPVIQYLVIESSVNSSSRTQTLALTSTFVRLVENPATKSEYIRRDHFIRSRNEKLAGLAFLMISDATLSVLYRDSEKQVSVHSSPTETIGLRFSKNF